MRKVQQISVQIGAVAGRSGEYLARWSSQFYGATFAVDFTDSILGAVALNTFAEMLRKHYDASSIRFEVTGSANPCGARRPSTW